MFIVIGNKGFWVTASSQSGDPSPTTLCRYLGTYKVILESGGGDPVLYRTEGSHLHNACKETRHQNKVFFGTKISPLVGNNRQ